MKENQVLNIQKKDCMEEPANNASVKPEFLYFNSYRKQNRSTYYSVDNQGANCGVDAFEATEMQRH